MNIIIGGAAGQGMDTIAHLLGKALARQGYGVLSCKDYMSRVRGGHNFTLLRIEKTTPWAAAEGTDILVALNEETYLLHRNSVRPLGRIVFDPESFPVEDSRAVPVRLTALAKEAGAVITSNTVAVGAVLALTGLDTGPVIQLLKETFAKKPEAVEQNIKALETGFREAQAVCNPCLSLPEKEAAGPRLYLDGNQLLGMAALASGCRFLSAYPMTPSTGIMSYLAAKQKDFDVVVEQAEDEIAAINMALGASFTGVRALTSTSGGGFALMAEGLSLAGMTETPIVVIVAMRPGPATGLPTRTEQGDLNFVLHAGHGDFPRAVLSATYMEDAFYRLNKAFELADKYQVPVIFLSDQNFADTARTIEKLDFSKLKYNRYLVDAETLETPYRRYRFTESGISPRALPGQFPGEIVLADSDEHDEDGHIIEDAHTRRLMVEKRLRKQQLLAGEMDEPFFLGEENPDLLLIGWGSTYGALREAVDLLNRDGARTAFLHFSDIWPLPQKRLSELLPRVKKSVCVENNATGHFNRLLNEHGFFPASQVLKYDGRPFTPEEIVREVSKHV